MHHATAFMRVTRPRSVMPILFLLALALVGQVLAFGSAHAASKKAHIIIDHATGEVLASAAADEMRYPASLTKMMTLYMLFDALDAGRVKMNTPLRVSSYAAGQAPTKLALAKGDTIPVETAIKALVVRSANDVAMVVAENLAGSEREFAAQMTSRARQLGMSRTTFRNPHGLPNSGQRSTARDLATLARALLRDHAQYYHFFSVEQFSFKGQTYRTHNRLMQRYDGMDGLKTGFINASGFNLASSVLRDGRRLVGVVLGGNTAAARDKDMERLLDAAFKRAPRSAPPQLMVDARPRIGGNATALPASRRVPVPMAAPGRIPVISASASPGQIPLLPKARHSSPMSEWVIQIGAFANHQQTDAALKSVANKHPNLSNYDGIVVPGRNQRGRAIYRARFIGLSQQEAQQACRTLKRAGDDCLALRAEG